MTLKLSSPFVLTFSVPAALLIALNTESDAQDASSSELTVVDGTMWSLVTSDTVPWAEADAFCESLDTGGYTDWRLPQLFELEALHDPSADDSIKGPFELDDCCAWSSESLADVAAEPKGQLPPPGGAPDQYYWGVLLADGISYYSNGRFPDGFAMCLRVTESG